MKKRIISIIAFLLVMSSVTVAQDDLATFKEKASQYYHTLARDDVKNFTCKISSSIYINFIKQYADSTFYYPLKFIWTSAGNGYYALQPLPELSDSLRRETLTRAQALKNLWSGIVYDMQKFIIRSPLTALPENAAATFGNDTVGISFSFRDKARQITSKETFTRGGQLGRVIWIYDTQKVVNYPKYKELGDKWLCTGWDSQVYENAQITSGIGVRVIYATLDHKIVPEQFNIVAQAREKENNIPITSSYTLFVKDFLFNEDLQFVSAPTDSGRANP